MIGQDKNVNYLSQMAELPHFLIVLGAKGSGRKTLLREQYALHGVGVSLIDGKVDAIRAAIEVATNGNGRYAFVLDSDDFSATSAGALLKITEECPSNAWFALVAPSRQAVLQTLQSRGTIIEMSPYSKDDFAEYAKTLVAYGATQGDVDVVYQHCETFGDAFRLISMPDKGRGLLGFANSIVDNVRKVPLHNALKIPFRVDAKGNNQDKYPPDLLLTMVLHVAGSANPPTEGSIAIVRATSWALGLLQNKSVNKAMLMDAWVMRMRGDAYGIE